MIECKAAEPTPDEAKPSGVEGWPPAPRGHRAIGRDSSTSVGSAGATAATAGRLADPALAPEAVLGRLGGENFPVAMGWLPRALRRDLVAVYGVARLIDEAGDAAGGDRSALLDAVEADLRAAFRGQARHPLIRRLEPVVRAHGLSVDPFLALVEANRWDQRAPDLASWEELRAYCALSAQPVGEIVLRIFGQASDANRRDADAVCTALQVLEHCQDVAEDARAGRCYLPADDRARCGCGTVDLVAAPAGEPLRRCVAIQVSRAREGLARGRALCRRLRGLARPVVAAYVGGGFATADALERAGFDPNLRLVRPRRRTTLRRALETALGWGAAR